MWCGGVIDIRLRLDLDETLAALEAARATHTSLTAAADSKDVQLSELQTELRAISLAAKVWACLGRATKHAWLIEDCMLMCICQGAASRKDEELAALRRQLEVREELIRGRANSAVLLLLSALIHFLPCSYQQAAAEHRASIDQAAGDREAAVRAVQAELESAHAQLLVAWARFELGACAR